jgi:hypothetical protein
MSCYFKRKKNRLHSALYGTTKLRINPNTFMVIFFLEKKVYVLRGGNRVDWAGMGSGSGRINLTQ